MKEKLNINYPITKERKKLWAIELEMIQILDNICKKHKIKYFFIYGSLLGAVRHEGFIPWDDDIDIGMLREDYEKFLHVAAKELDKKYFLQTELREDGYYDIITRIRDTESTGILKKDLFNQCNNGVFIEICPLDYVPSNKIIYILKKRGLQFCSKLIYESVYLYEGKNLVRMMISLLCQKCLNSKRRRKLFMLMTKMAHGKESEKVECILSQYNVQFRTIDLEETQDAKFEDLVIQIPKGYDKILTESYGDYMTPPPLDEVIKHHQDEVYYDPYKKYSEKEVIIAAKEFFGI